MELYLVFDNIQKPGNVGSAVRLAQALQAKLIFTGNSIKHTHPKCRAAAVGYIEDATVEYFETLDKCLSELSRLGIKAHGTSPYAKNLHWEIDYTGKTAIVFGNEVSGLSKSKQDKIGSNILIPIPGPVESLNLATSAAIIGYEALRQNRQFDANSHQSLQGKPDRQP